MIIAVVIEALGLPKVRQIISNISKINHKVFNLGFLLVQTETFIT